MKRLRWLVLLPALWATLAAAGPTIEFNGVLIESGKTSVSLLDLSTGVAKWVVVGSKFEGYTVKSYVPDPQGADAVEFSKNSNAQILRVGLKHAVILPAAPAPDHPLGPPPPPDFESSGEEMEYLELQPPPPPPASIKTANDLNRSDSKVQIVDVVLTDEYDDQNDPNLLGLQSMPL